MSLEYIVRPASAPQPFNSQKIVPAVASAPQPGILKWGATGNLPAPYPIASFGGLKNDDTWQEVSRKNDTVEVASKQDPNTTITIKRPTQVVFRVQSVANVDQISGGVDQVAADFAAVFAQIDAMFTPLFASNFGGSSPGSSTTTNRVTLNLNNQPPGG